MSGRFRMIAVGAALTLIINHGDLAPAGDGPATVTARTERAPHEDLVELLVSRRS